MIGGDYSHDGERCTFESLIHTFRIEDPALKEIAEIVHDIDIKDAKYARADAAGIQQLIEGIRAAHAKDEDRLTRAAALFDDLFESFRKKRNR